uniref:NADH-ubiquinone oxidoreductase chain 6 n=1 Tax=Zophobas atratus TaxID=7074 RepID=A0A410P8C0_ZOPAT|nr:NADH dehydrogenase subunit 6 [Zophobas atratus]QAT19106.1 NADH dehydrogenase subunit 6 [Zophobas atratus]
MLSILIATNMILTSIFIMMKHPLSMGSILLLQTITISLTTGFMNQNMWFSYILFLIMIGGMLILFMYMTSIASNEKFKTNLKILMIITPLPIIAWLTSYINKLLISNNELLIFNQKTEFMLTINKFINFPLSMILLFMMFYLLLALIATVKITNFKQGSIRQMN